MARRSLLLLICSALLCLGLSGCAFSLGFTNSPPVPEIGAPRSP